MPLLPVPDNATARLYLDYTSLGVEHTLLIRPARELSINEQGVMANAWASAMSTRMVNTDSVFAVRYSAALTNFSTPITYSPIPGALAVAGNLWDEDPESAFLSLTARSTTTGRNCRWNFFFPTATTTWPSDNRYGPGEAAVIDTFRTNITQLITFGSPAPVPAVCADNTFVAVKGYVNIGKHGYWQRKQR